MHQSECQHEKNHSGSSSSAAVARGIWLERLSICENDLAVPGFLPCAYPCRTQLPCGLPALNCPALPKRSLHFPTDLTVTRTHRYK